MSQKHDLNIVIDEEGNIRIEVRGFKGSGCEDLTRELEAALGIKVASQRTQEYFEEEETGVSVYTGADDEEA